MFARNPHALFSNEGTETQEENLENQGQDTPSNEGLAADFVALEAELAATRIKLEETHDRMLRIAADADNTRKRLEREKTETRIYCIQEFARDLLPILDSFEKAMTAVEDAQRNQDGEPGQRIESIAEGIRLVSRLFEDTFKKHGIEKLPGKDEPFNPSYHNAIAKVVDPSFTTETVVEEFVSGYRIGDRVLRTAMVKVGSSD